MISKDCCIVALTGSSTEPKIIPQNMEEEEDSKLPTIKW